MVTKVEPWTCPTCKTGVSTPFCPACGERPLRVRELTMRGLFEHMFEAFTNIDSRLIRSFRRLFSSPGFLTVAYLDGRRKPYMGPVSVFLIANVLFFATESLTGGMIRVLKTAALTVGMVIIVLAYRFVLLLITLYTT
jgi:hypothetical protein